MKHPVFVISLTRSTERRRLVREHFTDKQLPFDFMDAIDGKALPPGLVEKWYDDNKFRNVYTGREPLTPGELGCFFSHMTVWQRIIDSNLPGAFVMEDDVFMHPWCTPETLREVAALTQPGEIVLLQSTATMTWKRRRRTLPSGKGVIAYTLDDTMLSTAYYLTRAGAAAMLARWQREGILFQADHWYLRNPRLPSWAGTLPILVLKPDAAMQRVEVHSEIQALGRSGLSGAIFQHHRQDQQPTWRFEWRHIPRDGLRVVRRWARGWIARPARVS